MRMYHAIALAAISMSLAACDQLENRNLRLILDHTIAGINDPNTKWESAVISPSLTNHNEGFTRFRAQLPDDYGKPMTVELEVGDSATMGTEIIFVRPNFVDRPAVFALLNLKAGKCNEKKSSITCGDLTDAEWGTVDTAARSLKGRMAAN